MYHSYTKNTPKSPSKKQSPTMHINRPHHTRYRYLSPTTIYPRVFSPTPSSTPSSNALTFTHPISSLTPTLPSTSNSTPTTSYGNSYSSCNSSISSTTQSSTSYSTSQSTIIATKNDNPYLIRVLLLGINHDILAINIYNHIKKAEYYQEYTQESIPKFNISDIANIMINCIANNMKVEEQQNPALQLLIMENMNGRCYVTLGDGPMMPTFAVQSVSKMKQSSLSSLSLLSSSTVIIHEEEKEMFDTMLLPLPETNEQKKYESESETYEEMESFSIIDEEYFEKRKSFQHPIQRQKKCTNILSLMQTEQETIADVSANENDTHVKYSFISTSDDETDSTLNRTETEIIGDDENKEEYISNSALPVSDVNSIFELNVSAMVDRFQRITDYCSPKAQHKREISALSDYGQMLPMSTKKLKLFNSASDSIKYSTLPPLPPKSNLAFSNSEFFRMRKIEKRNMRKLRKRESKSVPVTPKNLLTSVISSPAPNITDEDYDNIYFCPQITKDIELREKSKVKVKRVKLKLKSKSKKMKENEKMQTCTKLKKYASINYNDIRKKTQESSVVNSLFIEQRYNKNINTNK